MGARRAGGYRKRRGITGKLLFVLLVLVVLLITVSVFFKIAVITVTGTQAYRPEEVVEASGVKEGDQLLFLNTFQIVGRIKAQLPYVDEVAISRAFPDTLVITVEDAVAAAWFETAGGCYLLDARGKVLEEVEAGGDLIRVVGVTPETPAVGQRVSFAETDSVAGTYLLSLLPLLEERDMLASVSEINLENATNAIFRYLSRFTVKLGPAKGLEDKLSLLEGTVAQLSGSAAGVIDLSDGVKASFLEEEAP